MVINRLLCGGAIATRASRWCWAREQTFHNRPARGLVGSCSSLLNIRKDFSHSAAMSVEVSKELKSLSDAKADAADVRSLLSSPTEWLQTHCGGHILMDHHFREPTD